MKITAIQGFAGTSKTTTLSRLIASVPDTHSFIGLSLTHHAVKNLLAKTREVRPYIESKYFKTIHSFFKIEIKSGFFIGSNKHIDYVFIDEFSMIDKELFKHIIKDCERNETIEIFIAGDFLQLPRVGTLKTSIDISTLKLLEGLTLTNDMMVPLQHFENSSLTLATKIIQKTKQYRNTNNKYLEWILNGTLKEHFEDFQFVNFDEVSRLINNNYTLIASKYSILDSFKEEPKINDFIYGTETINDIVNGNVYLIVSIEQDIVMARDIETDELIFFNKPYKFYPLNLYTFHKSQGLTFKNAIICIDDLFEFPMFYTGITRSAGDIKFFSTKTKEIREEYLENHSGEKEIKYLQQLFQMFLKTLQKVS